MIITLTEPSLHTLSNHTGYTFRPSVENEYLSVKSDDDDWYDEDNRVDGSERGGDGGEFGLKGEGEMSTGWYVKTKHGANSVEMTRLEQ